MSSPIGSLDTENFLWCGHRDGQKGINLVNWGRVCKKKEFGGLRALNLKDMKQYSVGGGGTWPITRTTLGTIYGKIPKP